MRKYITSVVGIFTIFFVANYYNVGEVQSVTSKLKSDIAALQRELPSKIDNFSTTVAASFENNILSYDVVLDVFVDSNDVVKMKNMQRNGNIFYACLNPQMLILLNEIDKLEYNYTVNTSGASFTTTVKKSDCQPFIAENNDALGEYYVQLMNTTVPQAVDSETNLVLYRKEGRTITLDYQLHSWLLAELDVPYFKNIIDTEVVPLMCDPPDVKTLVKRGYDFKLRYLDARNDEVYVTIIPFENC